MQLILAIDGDRRQAEQLAALVRSRLGAAELLQTTSVGDALQLLGDRVPDLIMTSPLLSPFDDGVLAEYLRDLGPAAAHIQTLRIPVFGTAQKKSVRSLFSLRRKRPAESSDGGCDPNVFADEIAIYLTRAAEERAAAASTSLREPAAPAVDMEPPAVEEEFVDEHIVDEPSVSPSDTYARYEDTPTYVPYQETPAYAADTIEQAEPEPVAYASAPIDPVEPEPVFYSAALVEEVEPEPPAAYSSAPVVHAEPEEVVYSRELLEDTTPEPVVPSSMVVEGVEPEAMALADVADAAPMAIVEPEPSEASRSTSFEAALAAIRAAWAHPRPAGSPELPSPAHVEAVEPEVVVVEVAELSASPALHDLDADLAAAAPPPAVRTPIDALAPARVEPVVERKPPSRKRTETSKKRSDKAAARRPSRPVQDEWGVFDPSQCGFSALVDKLDEVTELGDTQAVARTSVRVISFS